MKQTVCSAQIYECTEIGYVLYNTLYHIAYMDALEELFLLLSLFSNDQLLTVTDDAATARIELGNNKADLLTFILRQVLLIGIGYQACRDEYSGLIYNNA